MTKRRKLESRIRTSYYRSTGRGRDACFVETPSPKETILLNLSMWIANG
jgi:hypothetical protein